MAPISSSQRIVDQPRTGDHGWFNGRSLIVLQRILALSGMLLGSAIVALVWMVLVNGQYSQAGIIENLAEQVRVRSPADLERRRLEVRGFMIRSQLAQAKSPIVIMGDSITEAALLPSSMCGRDIVNAGVGGMTVGSYLPLAKQLLAGRRVQSIIVALGIWNIVERAHRKGLCEFDR